MRTSQPPGQSGKRQARVAALSEVATICARAHSVRELSRPLASAARRALGARTFALALQSTDGEPWVTVSGADQYGLGIWATQALVRWSEELSEDSTATERLNQDAPPSVLAAPVIVRNRLRGVIAGRGFRAREPQDKAELVLATVARSLSIAIRALEAESATAVAEQGGAVIAAVLAANAESAADVLESLTHALAAHVVFSQLRLSLLDDSGARSELPASVRPGESGPPPSGEWPRAHEVALVSDGEEVGVLQVLSAGQPSAAERALLDALAPRLAEVLSGLPVRAERRDSERIRDQLMQSERLASVGQLAQGVAHEVNNPLSVIMSNLSLLLERTREGDAPTDEEVEDVLGESIEGVRRIASTVEHLRDFARGARSGSVDLDLNDVVRAAVSIVDGQIRYRAHLDLELGELPAVRGDHGKLVQLVTNLLLNAAQAFDESHQEQNRIRLRTRVEDGTVRLVIRDNGAGIPAAQLERIFEPFFTTKSSHSATGLGLAVSADIVRRHGGKITVKSREGLGSRFDVVLPTAPVAISSRPLTAPAQRPQFRARILLVDDDAAVLRSLGRVLSRRHDVVAVDGGAAALALLRRDSHFDVIVCDVMMPDVDGVAVFDALSEIAPELRRRTIFCTGGEFTARTKSFLAATDRTVLIKPVTTEALTSAIVDVLSRTQSMLPNTGNDP
ncbi:MAG: response regulator [Myxococcales bacterium]|nr:response regulator [Myxococcales bacterium]MCB9578487.1 response regulator [Polyangiaceae bacterium]